MLVVDFDYNFGKSLFTRSVSWPYTIQDIKVSGIVKEIDSCRIWSATKHYTWHCIKGNCHSFSKRIYKMDIFSNS